MPQPMHLPPDPAGQPPGRHASPPSPGPAPSPQANGRHQNGSAGLFETADDDTARTPPTGFRGPAADAARPPAPRPRSTETDSSGRQLAMRLPEWDLLPPTEFVQRPRGR